MLIPLLLSLLILLSTITLTQCWMQQHYQDSVVNKKYTCASLTIIPRNKDNYWYKKSNDVIWSQLLPPIWNSEARGVDVSVTCTINANDDFIGFEVAAEELLQKCGVRAKKCPQDEFVNGCSEQLILCFKAYKNVVERFYADCKSDNDNEVIGIRYPVKFKARIVSSRGSVGVKCPRWHVDHVPVRLLCALKGPGVCYVPNSKDYSARNISNSSDDVSTVNGNYAILRDTHFDQVNPSEIAILAGKVWEVESKSKVKAVIHKSPNILPFIGRVFLSIDVI